MWALNLKCDQDVLLLYVKIVVVKIHASIEKSSSFRLSNGRKKRLTPTADAHIRRSREVNKVISTIEQCWFKGYFTILFDGVKDLEP